MPAASFRSRAVTVCSALALAGLAAAITVSARAADASVQFVRTAGDGFVLAGKPFFVAGVNNHYLTFGTEQEVRRVLDDAVQLHANVIRVFLQPVIGSLDGRVPSVWNWQSPASSSDLGVNGTYLLYWDRKSSQMAINEGASGMHKVDFLVDECRKRNIKLIIALLDFWAYTGGAQQMRAWYKSVDRNRFFFEDPRTRSDYRRWAHYVVNRANSLNGRHYKDDPTIMAWELMNEANIEPASLKTGWVSEMSSYLKSEDSNHLVASGGAGVNDRLADMRIPTVDFGTWHGYPLFYGLTVQQFNKLIDQSCNIAANLQKPVLLEEFGYARSNSDQADAYQQWLDKLQSNKDCAGWLVWRLVSYQQDGKYPLDEHDQFDIRNDGSPIWSIIKEAAEHGVIGRGHEVPRQSDDTGRPQ
ncbi:MAG: cellulase family glycosylhydrolase [Alphaproteobacteria bacterium]|nr:cellulase family glycosylhydrolase [Alphaproteobacteria bacterium]